MTDLQLATKLFKKYRKSLKLHKLDNNPYYIGIFLIGAYQEILGNLHNLFGNTNVVHIKIKNNNKYLIKERKKTDSIKKILQNLEYNNIKLIKSIQKSTQQAVKSKIITKEKSKKIIERLKKNLKKSTYLNI